MASILSARVERAELSQFGGTATHPLSQLHSVTRVRKDPLTSLVPAGLLLPSSLGCVGASPHGSSSASDWARLTKPSGSQESTLLRSGRMGRGSISKRRWRKDRKRRKLAREKRKHELQSARHGRG